MAEGYGIILRVVEPIKIIVFDRVKEYVSYIGSCEGNLGSLSKNLSDLYDKKEDINRKVKAGEARNEAITNVARSWLKDVRILTEQEELRMLMCKDMRIAKWVVKIMEKKDLKKCLSKENEMQDVVLKVLPKLKEEVEQLGDGDENEMREAAYKKVVEVVVEVMKDTIEEFKKVIKEDNNIAVVATRMLTDRDLDKLTNGDTELKGIIEEAGNVSDEEFGYPHAGVNLGESSPLLVNLSEPVIVNENPVNAVVWKLFTPLGNLIKPLKKLMDDANFKEIVPQVEGVKLGLEVIDGLWIKGMNDNTKQYRGCCCCTRSLCNYHDRYQISKSAEQIIEHIRDHIISSYPHDSVTLPISASNFKLIPTAFLKGLDSRTQLLEQILEKLKNDQGDAIGVYGMGGAGKTTLAKEVNKRAPKEMFSMKVMVEVSESPNIARIQAAIAESIDLPLHNVQNVAQRAIRLYNRLISEKEKKVLVILDNVWKEIDLSEIGIPRSCKLLLTTREKKVCTAMRVQDDNILEVGLMNDKEARDLFNSQIGFQADTGEHKIIVEGLLRKCGGLPLAIVATTNSLKDKDLPSWKTFANDLEKPISSQVSSDYRHIYSIISTSYKFIEVKEKRIFFLLACLIPLSSSISIDSLMRYGIGLNLFQYMNNLCEAMKEANKWVNELKASSMLLSGDEKEDVKIHDIVRDFAISFAAKDEGHKFMIEAIPRWLDNETLKTYTGMLLLSKNDYSRLGGIKTEKLQILILKGDLLPNFHHSFFKGMVNLEVLSMSNMNFMPGLPKSIRKLKRIRTLCLEGCKLGDIKQVGELGSLLVLSLSGSFFEELPCEIGELSKLRLLDLTGCTSSKVPLIPVGILDKLSELEGLYLFNTCQDVFDTKSENKRTSATTNDLLYNLNVLEVKVAQIEQLPFDCESVQNLDKFRVRVGDGQVRYGNVDADLSLFHRIIDFCGECDMGYILEISCLRELLKKADWLGITKSNNIEALVPQLDDDGFKDLGHLQVRYCKDITCIVKGSGMSDLIAFPCLRSLELSFLDDLKMVCGEAPVGTFSSLESLRLTGLDVLAYVMPLSLYPHDLNDIQMYECDLMNFVFKDNKETQVIELPALKSLTAELMPNLLSFAGSEEFTNTSDGLQGNHVFFSKKIVFPSLEMFELWRCDKVVKLWGTEICNSSFQSLKTLKIRGCEKLSSIGSASVFFALVQLEFLSIEECEEMREIITVQEEGQLERCEQILTFPRLKFLELSSLDNVESFYGGGFKLEFPELKELKLFNLKRMSRFAKLESSLALFHEKIAFPCLEELEMESMSDEVTKLWNWQESNAPQQGNLTSNFAPMLKRLSLGRTGALRRIPPIICESLTSLRLTWFDKDDVVFSLSNLSAKEEFAWKYSQLPKLVELRVSYSKALKELFSKEDCNGSLLKGFCEQLKLLHLYELPELNLVPLHLFGGLVSLSIYGVKWEYTISADLLGVSLPHLEFLTIKYCEKMETFVIKLVSDFKLPRLKELCLRNLASLATFSSSPNRGATLHLPLLESLDIFMCNKIRHFWSGLIVAPALQRITVKACHNMQWFLNGNPNSVIQLPSLHQVEFTQCPNIKSISFGPLTAPKLREVKLGSCDGMKSFLKVDPNHNGDLQLPALEIVNIVKCPNIRSFSRRHVLSPNLTHIQYNKKEYSMLQFQDLNHFLRTVNYTDDYGEDLNLLFAVDDRAFS